MNQKKSWIRIVAVAASGLLLLSACSSSDDTAAETSDAATAEETVAEETAAEETAADDGACTELTPVSLQLQWFVQAQFGGYYAAKDLGYYEDQCLDVTILEG
ncbi:MAG: ABC transporter substrate-binding protein, partial [Candidatus Nanopelagicales bacterium]